MIVGALRVLLGLGETALLGFVFSRRFSGGLSRGERAAWALATGLVVQAILVVLLAAAGIPLRPLFLVSAGILVFAAAAAAGGSRPRPAPGLGPGERAPRWSPAARLLFGAALAAWTLFLVAAAGEPMWATDYLAIWGLKGKTIFETGGLPARLFRDPALYWAHREYPLLVPLSLAALAGVAGEWNDRALALLFPGAALATLLAISGFLARRGSRTAGAAAALLAALCFRLYHPVNAGTAEVIFALGAVLAACAFLDFAERDAPEARARVFVAALFCAATKQEGTLWIALLGILYLAGRRGRLRSRETALGAAAFAVPPAAHWILLFLLRGPETRRDFDFRLFEPASWAALAHRFGDVVGRVATTEAREAAVPLAAIALFLLLTRRAFADVLLPALLVQVFFYCVAFSVSSFDPMYAVEGAFRRIALTLFPTLTLILGARLASPAPETAARAAPADARG